MSTILNLFVKIIIFLTFAQMFKIFNAIGTAKDAATNETDFTFLVSGGYRPPNHTFTKYLVSLQRPFNEKFFGDNHFCGGTIIGLRIILTAAHCMMGEDDNQLSPDDLRVVAKTSNRLVRTDNTLIFDVELIRVHPGFNPKSIQNDIAIVKILEDIPLDGRFAEIMPMADGPPSIGQNCTVVGWGRVLPFGPLAADAIYGDFAIYNKMFCSLLFGKYVEHGQICAYSSEKEVDACTGDSGGPLMCDSKQFGLVSYGSICATGAPGVYSDVWYFRTWIKENHSCCHAGSIFLILFFASVVIFL